MSVSTMFQVQRTLSKAQAIPLVGPVVFSPVKAVVSLAQIIAGVAGTILFGTVGFFTDSPSILKPLGHSIGHMGMGLTSFVYSGINMATLGLFGISMEGLFSKDFEKISFA